jgi:heptosyltransferase II
VYVPAEVERLQPFRVLIRSNDFLDGAAMSVEAARRIKRGRPDLRLSVLVVDRLADFWRNVSEVDEVLQIEDGSSVFAVARKIRGRFDVAILFPSFLRPGIEIWLAGIPRRVGFSTARHNSTPQTRLSRPHQDASSRRQSYYTALHLILESSVSNM